MDASRTRSLVTGGAGFIGSHLVERLLARGDDVTVIDNFSTGSRENLVHLDSERMTCIDGTVAEVLSACEPDQWDEIYHLAAAVGVRLVIERPIHTIETNIEETSVVLRYATHGRPRVLIASSSEVYGKGTKTPFHEDDDVLYGPTIFSRWSYACSKAIDEYLALAYAGQHALPVVVARFFNTVGPRQIGNYGMVLPRFVDAALRGEPLTVHGDGLQTRCFCDVRDVVRLLPQLIESEGAHGRVVNVGNDTPISILDLARTVIDTLDSSSEVQLVPYDEAFGEGFDDLRVRQPDLTRLRALTSFAPAWSLDATIHAIADDQRRAASATPSGGERP
ncbi:MAG: NAD-dependent epimerase/dehydratase family protein [Planctomycetota bacterium]